MPSYSLSVRLHHLPTYIYPLTKFNAVHQFVLPKLASIDGQTVPVLYQQMIVPWMIQSPLMPNILILVSSFVRGMHRRIDVNKCAETIALKANVLALTNKFLARDFEVIGTEALLAVSHIATIEVSSLPSSSLNVEG